MECQTYCVCRTSFVVKIVHNSRRKFGSMKTILCHLIWLIEDTELCNLLFSFSISLFESMILGFNTGVQTIFKNFSKERIWNQRVKRLLCWQILFYSLNHFPLTSTDPNFAFHYFLWREFIAEISITYASLCF